MIHDTIIKPRLNVIFAAGLHELGHDVGFVGTGRDVVIVFLALPLRLAVPQTESDVCLAVSTTYFVRPLWPRGPIGHVQFVGA